MPTDRLGWNDSVAALRELEGRAVAVRIALGDHEEALVAVFHAALGVMDVHAKQPLLFLPLGDTDPHPERSGLYLQEDDFVAGERRAGGIVVIKQRDVVVNVRPLGAEDK